MSDKERLKDIKENISFSKENHEFSETFYEDMDWLVEQAEKVEQYEKAIKECVERMDEGGAGTRSFVYEKLTEVMEGTECMGK